MFKVTASKREYNDFFSEFPEGLRDIYFFYEYIDLYTETSTDVVMAALYKSSEGGLIFYCFIRSDISDKCMKEGEKLYDISSCYGYSGPLIYRCSREDIEEFENSFIVWCRQNNIVSEFIRYHPLYENQYVFCKEITVEKNRSTAIVDLTSKDIEEIWNNQIDSKNRNQIRKAVKSGVTIEQGENLTEFVQIYNETMKRLQADDFYLFNRRYYEKLKKWNRENYCILYAVYEEKIIAASIFLFSKECIHYHLSGSLREYQHLCANNLLLFRAIGVGIERGCKKFHLGGGRSSAEDDSLLRFKKSFSKNLGTFYIGKRVHNEKKYRQLIENWEKENNRKATLFLQYRQ